MAVDTKRKRASALRFSQVWAGVLPVAVGSFDQEQRQTAIWMYLGILVGAAVPDEGYPPGGDISANDLDRVRRIEDDDLIAVITGFLIASRNIR